MLTLPHNAHVCDLCCPTFSLQKLFYTGSCYISNLILVYHYFVSHKDTVLPRLVRRRTIRLSSFSGGALIDSSVISQKLACIYQQMRAKKKLSNILIALLLQRSATFSLNLSSIALRRQNSSENGVSRKCIFHRGVLIERAHY